jgi:Peptidase family M28
MYSIPFLSRMKTQFILILSVFISNFATAQGVQAPFEATLLEDDLRRHLTYIASDAMEGRDTGSEGQKKVGNYIVDHFKAIGLSAIVPNGGMPSYYQNFNLYKTGWKEAYVKINDKKKVFFRDFYPTGLVNIPVEKTIETVFVGYGIKTETHDDYKHLDIKGKAVVFVEGEPKNEKMEYIYSKSSVSMWIDASGTKRKQQLAAELGALCSFEISLANTEKFKTLNAERKAILSRFNRMALEKNTSAESVSFHPSFVISKSMAADILGVSLKKIEAYLKRPFSSKKLNTAKTSIAVKSERGQDLLETANILGFLEGTDKKDEVIVVTAHYDHVGVDEKGQIYNGADDDGSGTCAVLELAEAFAKAKAAGVGPRRSLLFMLVTGEEKGLLGSQYYADIDPVIPLDKIMCDLNIDMIGRVDKKHKDNPNYVYLIGSDKLSSELHQISEQSNAESIGFELDYEFNNTNDPNRFYYRSDHYNFAKNNIPVVFYFTGVHEDYHKPTDDVEKIMFPKYNQIVKLIFHTVWALSNRDNRIVVDSHKP